MAVIEAGRLWPLLAGIAVAAAPALAGAQQLYKYRGADGVWVYTDRRPPPDRSYEKLTLAEHEEQPAVRLYRQTTADGQVRLFAQNTFYGPVQIAFELTEMDNLAADVPKRGLTVLPARSNTRLLTLRRGDAARPMSLGYEFQYLLGDPKARHDPPMPYRFPFALATRFKVSQAFPDQVTHNDPSSRYAIDFAMPIGTGVYAARAGTVVQVASDYYEAGLDPVVDGPRANIVRVLHDDGTMSLYAHLNWNSIRVVPGQRVARGEYLADSGNTGFTTGPHLHFVVQRNRNGTMISVPVQFAGPAGDPITVTTGDEPEAY